jgi:hypothetical protein
MKRILILIVSILIAKDVNAAVAFDAVAHNSTSVNGTSIPNFTLTIGGGVTNGAVVVGVSFESTVPTGVGVTIGGTSANLVSNTTATNGTVTQTLIYCLATGSSTGAKTITVTWTGTSGAGAGAISFSGADQTTPCNNGNNAIPTTGGTPTAESISITSTSGDLTFDWNNNNGGNTQPTAPNQTSRFSFTHADFNNASAGSTGPGTGTATHTWTFATFEFISISGVNIKAATGGGPPGCKNGLLLLGSGCEPLQKLAQWLR